MGDTRHDHRCQKERCRQFEPQKHQAQDTSAGEKYAEHQPLDLDRTCQRVCRDLDAKIRAKTGTISVSANRRKDCVIGTRTDRKATHISVLTAIGVRRDERKVLLCLGNMGGESPAWRQVLEGLAARGLQRPGGVVVDGAPGPKAAPVALWGDELPIQRCTGHKHRNLLAHASEHMQDEFGEDYRDTIHAETATEVEKRRKAFLRKWQMNCRAVADSLEEAGDRLFTFTRLHRSQWRPARNTNAIERPNEEARRRIETQTVLPGPETGPICETSYSI